MNPARVLASSPSFLLRSLVPLELLFGGGECCQEVLLLPRCCATFLSDFSKDFVCFLPLHLWILLFPRRPLLLEEPVVGRNSLFLRLRFVFLFCLSPVFRFVLSLHYGGVSFQSGLFLFGLVRALLGHWKVFPDQGEEPLQYFLPSHRWIQVSLSAEAS